MPTPHAYQLPLFPLEGQSGELGPPVTTQPGLRPDASLASAIGAYADHMVRKGFSANTINAFRSDLRLLSRFVGRTTPITRIATKDLLDFLKYLREGRGVPCSPKSYQRRITTLKNFFGWLAEEEIISRDPAAPLINETVFSPLPEVLFEDDISTLLGLARARRTDSESPDARPYLLLMLLLKTGIKKSEAVGIALDHLDLSRKDQPVVYIRYNNPRHTRKERKLALPVDFAEVFAEYRAQYEPQTHLFECTPRNLEYVLEGLAEAAGLSKPCGFEVLRMTCAARDWQAGMAPDLIRQKLGLSEITWRETGAKIERLAGPAL
ncbi:MAG: site-specific integrase [Ardenticatenaceae bacterium]|nr:site-specific integrase [Ardenticatenaceae bacterium]